MLKFGFDCQANWTPLMHACKVQSIRLVNFIIAQMRKVLIPMDDVNKDNETALVIAAKSGNLNLVRTLVEKHSFRPFPIVCHVSPNLSSSPTV
jgi:ankyrin repeat protein